MVSKSKDSSHFIHLSDEVVCRELLVGSILLHSTTSIPSFLMIPFAKHQSAFSWRLYANGSCGPLHFQILFWNVFAQEPLGFAQSDFLLPLERRGL